MSDTSIDQRPGPEPQAAPETPAAPEPPPARPTGTPGGRIGRAVGHRLGGLLVSLRPALIFGALVAVGVYLLAAMPAYNPTSPLTAYSLRVSVIVLALAGTAAVWWASRRAWTWDADLVAGLFGVMAALTVIVALHGTPYGLGGLSGDQTFRTESVTRFAGTWHTADFTYRGLPAFYAPAYFWVLGRAASLGGIEPWRMIKYGTILVALVLPLVTYLLWRRLVPARAAALIAGIPLVVESLYEPYSWLVIFAIVPWWMAAVYGQVRPGIRPHHPVVLGLVGAALFTTYYYFFFVAVIALVLHVVVERLAGQLTVAQLLRTAVVMAIAAAGSAVFWLPLGLSLIHAGKPESLANRWFQLSHAQPELTMTQISVVGLMCLLGLAFLVWTAPRDRLSRGMLVFLVAAYVWYLVGLPAALADSPLLSFRGRTLVPVILLSASVLALVRLVEYGAARSRAADVRRLAIAGGLVLSVTLGQAYVTEVLSSPRTAAAHAATLPNGRLPRYHSLTARPVTPSVDQLRRAIEARYTADDHPVVLTSRADLLAIKPYFGFVQFNAHYSHPAGEFHDRIRVLEEMAAATTSQELATRAANNPFDPIDVFVLRVEGEAATFRYGDDAFPDGLVNRAVIFHRDMFKAPEFDVTQLGGYLVAVRRA